MSKELRQALRGLSPAANSALEVLKRWEKDELALTPDFCQALCQVPIHFLTFACLGTKRGRQELKLDLKETIFMKKYGKQARELLEEITAGGANVKFEIILPDLEPVRTWGWSVPREELTLECEIIVEEAQSSLPSGWEVKLWSQLEKEAGADYQDFLDWAIQSAPLLILDAETQFFRELPERFPDIVTAGAAAEVARRQIAAYAMEGSVLEKLRPRAILLQSDFPTRRKDAMLSCRRVQPILSCHPFEQ